MLALDDVRGGDGIVATRDIQTDRRSQGQERWHSATCSASQFYINVLLREVGLREADIEVVDLHSRPRRPNAFMMQEVDAAVTWEPYLSQGRNAAHGHLLTDSSERPGLIVDCLATKASIFSHRKRSSGPSARAWDAAVRYAEAHPAEANAIMARDMATGSKIRRCSLRCCAASRLYDAARTGNTSARPSNPVRSIEPCNTRSMSGSSSALLKAQLTPADVIVHGILDE